MIFKINYRYLQSYLTFYYEYLPKINTKDREKQSLDVDKSILELRSIAKEKPNYLL